MVQGSDADDLTHFNQSPGNLDVFLAGSGITTGMVVNKENSRSRLPNRRTVDLARINQRGGQGSFRNSNHLQNAILAVKEKAPETLLLQPFHQRSEVTEDLDTGTKRLSRRQRIPLNAVPQLDGGQDLQSLLSIPT
jgi:hypothetical protein